MKYFEWYEQINPGDFIVVEGLKTATGSTAGFIVEDVNEYSKGTTEIKGKNFATLVIEEANEELFKFTKVNNLQSPKYSQQRTKQISWGDIENGQHIVCYAPDGKQWFEINEITDDDTRQPFYVNKVGSSPTVILSH